MTFKLDLTCIKIKLYTKFQLNISKHVGEKCGKLWRTDGRTDGRRPGRTDGRTDGHHHTIIRPVWRRAYKNFNLGHWTVRDTDFIFGILWNTLFSGGSIFVGFLKLTGSWVCKFVDLIAWTKFWKCAFRTKLKWHFTLKTCLPRSNLRLHLPLNNKYSK